jgi:hypothetical protein
VFPTSFLTKDYKSHRANVLFERERSLFPDTMIHIQRDKEIDKIRENINQLITKQHKIKSYIYNLQRQLYNMEHNTHILKEKQKSYHVRPCVAEDCKGYINEETGVCGICSKHTCIKCNILITEDHPECKEEDLSVWAEIKKNTRPCPNCHVRIHKISGCYQMWCPQCHTAFNYNTGQIEKGAIHNPHYYDYLRQNPNAAHHTAQQPIPFCGGNRLPEAWRITRVLNKHKDRDEWMNFHRLLQHIQNVEIPKYQNRDADFTLDLRKKYMLNEMDETNFKRRIQEREKRAKKMDDMRTIWEMFFTVGKDMIITILNSQITDDLHNQMTNLINYVNENIKTLNYNYQSRLPHIEKFSLV